MIGNYQIDGQEKFVLLKTLEIVKEDTHVHLSQVISAHISHHNHHTPKV
jgi:hypothetical protein